MHILALAEASDVYGAAWLTASCGEIIVPHAPQGLRDSLERYAAWAKASGHNALSKRYEALIARA